MAETFVPVGTFRGLPVFDVKSLDFAALVEQLLRPEAAEVVELSEPTLPDVFSLDPLDDWSAQVAIESDPYLDIVDPIINPGRYKAVLVFTLKYRPANTALAVLTYDTAQAAINLGFPRLPP